MGKYDVFAFVDDVLDMPNRHIILVCNFIVSHTVKQSVPCHLPVTARKYKLIDEVLDLVTREVGHFFTMTTSARMMDVTVTSINAFCDRSKRYAVPSYT